MDDIKKVYKAVRVDGRELKSIWAGNPLWNGPPYIGCTYVEGEITYAPGGQMGLSVFGTLEDAKTFCKHNSADRQWLMVIHEAVPLGSERAGHDACTQKSAHTYPAILLGKEVWRDKPKGEWVDVTRDCVLTCNSSSFGKGYFVGVTYRGRWLMELGLGKTRVLGHLEDYKIEDLGESATPNTFHYFRVLKRQ